MTNPMKIRAKADGAVVEVKVLMSHRMETGLRKSDAGDVIPAHYIQLVTATYGDRTVLSAQREHRSHPRIEGGCRRHEAAHVGQLEMGMSVDERRHDGNRLRSGRRRRNRASGWRMTSAAVDDSPGFDSDPAIADRRSRDGQHPRGAMEDQ